MSHYSIVQIDMALIGLTQLKSAGTLSAESTESEIIGPLPLPESSSYS
jgi:hypothetical protein